MKKVLKREVVNKPENIKWEYDIVYKRFFEYAENIAESISNLKKEVNKKCNEGWIPEGAISIIEYSSDGSKYLCQTMIRLTIDSTNGEPTSTGNDGTWIRPPYDNITLSEQMSSRPADYFGDGEL